MKYYNNGSEQWHIWPLAASGVLRQMKHISQSHLSLIHDFTRS